jgi:ABC-2 type transport system ATP-binding protein
MPDLLEPADAGGRGDPLNDAAPRAVTVPPVGDDASRDGPGRNGVSVAAPPPRGQFAPPRAGEAVLLFEQVSKWYGPVIGVNHVTLELRPGITGLVGANGSGKSTLLKLAAGQIQPEVGSVRVRGLDAWTAAAKRHLGYCPELDIFYEEMTGRAFLHTMARLCGYTARASRRRTDDVLELVAMTDQADKRLRGYSKGMRQRIKLAQALLHDPELLLLDEPLSGIDPVGRRDSIAVFQELARRGKCLLVSSHELEELEKLTDHVAIMARGRIAAVGEVTQIRDLLDKQPLSVRIVCDEQHRLACGLLELEDVVSVEMQEDNTLLVRCRNPRRFFPALAALVLEEKFDIQHLESLDDSMHAVLEYLLKARR